MGFPFLAYYNVFANMFVNDLLMFCFLLLQYVILKMKMQIVLYFI